MHGGFCPRSTLTTLGDSALRRYDRSWKVAAGLLGIVALVVASVAVNLVELAAPWELVMYFVVIAAVLLGGTLWLVPSRRSDQSERRTVDHNRV